MTTTWSIQPKLVFSATADDLTDAAGDNIQEEEKQHAIFSKYVNR